MKGNISNKLDQFYYYINKLIVMYNIYIQKHEHEHSIIIAVRYKEQQIF